MGEGARIPWGRLVLGLVLGLGVATALVVLIGPLVAMSLAGGGHHQVRDDAMAPALVAGDWVLTERLHPGETPERGDIVVYEVPGGRGEERVARVVGLPGDRVQMRGGALYLNGARARMEEVGERVVDKRPPDRRTPLPLCLNEPVAVGDPCRQEIWRETLPDGTEQRVINSRGEIGVAKLSGPAEADNTSPLRVPREHVFVLGDNRDQAEDSRDLRHGPVPLDRVTARVWMIHTSLDRTHRFFTPRWERFFQRVD